MNVSPLQILMALALVGLPSTLGSAEPPPVRTLGRVFAKLKAGEETTIVYFGGSITAAPGYRVKTFKWIRESFPGAKTVEVNAAIGGTGSDLGAFRCAADVIAKRPDLVFLEFSLNDGHPTNEFRKATVEGIVRQLWASPTRPEIVFLYTTSRSLNHPRVSYPAVARHYGIPEIDLQPVLVAAAKRTDWPKPTAEQRADTKKFDWTQPGQVFMGDAVHPNELGHSLYAEAIIGWLKGQMDAVPSPAPQLGAPLVSEEFAHVALVEPSRADLSGDWERLAPDPKSGKIGRYAGGAINAREAGAALAFSFEGTALGIYLNIQADGGKFEWTVDDGVGTAPDPAYGGPRGVKKGVVDTAPGKYFPRYSYALLTTGLSPGRHTLKLRVLEEKDATSTGNRLMIGAFMVGGMR
ncbi:MAG: SGNH/GDSL hydrolase family protein [Verrucomicrobia bacterium]|nr:SGNH/GDSL hydrolase family protein [Verrucomicrobiota bacterium]